MRDVPGVLDVEVDSNGEAATVTYDDAKTDVKAMKQALREAGMDVTP